ncbi:phosphate ABC transporter, permease protein PstA [Anaerofustis stercorihominis DSM 17244]|uniref:Phosphate transport system permease protein PstA n=2 Tax=Anaerofustis stercorihominis TaxID=214853 RepID=B1C9A1_9FIRM|nr:phosphate ABC transporter, permease protein PstA [Anaerofustis stercorihominis DSM 17244]
MIKQEEMMKKKKFRLADNILKFLVIISAGFTALLALSLVLYVMVKGVGSIDLKMLTTSPSELTGSVGVFPMIINTLYMIVLTLVIAVPIGIGSAIYLNEYARKESKLVKAVEFTTQTLAGIPSIIYGLFGYMFFSIFLGLRVSIISGTLTLSIMVLPTLIRTTQEALSSVPNMYREGALGMGAKKIYLIRTILLPCSMPGIVTAVILSVGKVVGESAALIFTAGMGYMLTGGLINHMFKSGATLTVQLYLYASRGENLSVCFALASILIVIVLIINLSARLLSKKLEAK